MDKRFLNLFNLTEEEAIALLITPQAELEDDDSRYVAASHLANFPSERSIDALIHAVQTTDSSLDNRIVRRKSIETLGRLQATRALPVLRLCLTDLDCYTVETTVWAIGEIGTQDVTLLEEVAQLLEKPDQLYRAIIHVLNRFNYKPALERIRRFVASDDPSTACAAISAVCRLTQNFKDMEKVVAVLQHQKVFARRLAIQDLVDARYYSAIPQISQSPVSLVFRLRGIRLLAESGIAAKTLTFTQVQPYLEKTLRDHPQNLNLVHSYAQPPPLADLVQELYETDFGRCYLATRTILDLYPEEAPLALFEAYAQEAHNDYGAHYHIMKLMGWLKHAPAYDLLIEALHNKAPQFQKSRAAAAIALGELDDPRALPELKACLETSIWDLQYAALMALERLEDTSAHGTLANDPNLFLQAKVMQS
jgi:bilin biosynthesis protein